MQSRNVAYQGTHDMNDILEMSHVVKQRLGKRLAASHYSDVDFTSVKSFVRAISRINFTIYCDFNVWSDSVL